jgi:hypothetical protein
MKEENKTLNLSADLKSASALLSVLECARDNGVSVIKGTLNGAPFELDRSDEIRAEYLRGLN